MEFWCEVCEVHGSGDACWSCGSTDLVRKGPRVDEHTYGWPTDPNSHSVFHPKS